MSDVPADMTRRRFVKVAGVATGTLVVGGGALKAATYAPEAQRPSMTFGDGEMTTLVVYGTKSGCTTDIAKKIGSTLAEKGMTADVVAAEDAPDPAPYDAIIVGSGVRVGSWHESAKTWVTQNAAALKASPVAFYTCGLTLANDPDKTDEVRAFTDTLIAESGVTPVDVGLFAGWNEPKHFSFVERTVMKLMKAPQGDFRDFDAVADWAAAVAPRLTSAT